jgi:predicted polyphosphate/ATP-dependent NAD kinase
MKKNLKVGVIANPSSGRDLRRLLSWASISTSSEKVNTVLRLITALASQGVEEVFLMPDDGGLSRRIKESVELVRPQMPSLPFVSMINMIAQGGSNDSTVAATLMADAGAGMLVVLGGDGTHRAVAKAETSLPLCTISTGTNNAFPGREDATVIGLAAGLYLSGKVPESVALIRNKRLRIKGKGWEDIALVDICFSRQTSIGGKAVWQERDIQEVFVAFAEPWAMGLSSLAGLSSPITRAEPKGARIKLGPGQKIQTMMMPGMITDVSIKNIETFLVDTPFDVIAPIGTIAFDGEREIELDFQDTLEICLDWKGPETINPHSILEFMARTQGNPETRYY